MDELQSKGGAKRHQLDKDSDKVQSERIETGNQSLESLSDKELLADFKNGNETAFDTLVRRYQTKVYQLAWRMVRNHEDAWELAQDTFIRAYKAIPKFKEKSSFYTWLYRICFNLCITFSKKKQKDKKMLSLDIIPEERLMLEPVLAQLGSLEPEMIEEKHFLSNAISKAVDQLPLQQRLVFIMRQYDGLKNEEIADALDISLSGAKSNYHQAVIKLREMLKELL